MHMGRVMSILQKGNKVMPKDRDMRLKESGIHERSCHDPRKKKQSRG